MTEPSGGAGRRKPAGVPEVCWGCEKLGFTLTRGVRVYKCKNGGRHAYFDFQDPEKTPWLCREQPVKGGRGRGYINAIP